MQIERKTLIEMIPVFTGFIIIASICKAIAYYSVFDIRIIPFLDFSECLLMFLDDFIFLISLIALQTVIIFITEDENSVNENPSKPNSKVKRTITISYTFIFISHIIVWFITLIILPIKKGLPYAIVFTTFSTASIITIKLAAAFRRKYNRTYNRTIDRMSNITVMSGLIILYWMTAIGFFEAYKLKDTKNSDISILTKENKRFVTSDSLKYIGSTKNYIFFLNPKNNTKIIVSTSELLEISIH